VSERQQGLRQLVAEITGAANDENIHSFCNAFYATLYLFLHFKPLLTANYMGLV
jgi:hypothetical protein